MTKDVKAKVLYNTSLKGGYLRLGLATGWSQFDPGQFVMVRVPDDVVFVRRPFSVSRAIDDGIELLYKVVGVGTERLSQLAEGEEISVMGPSGRGFSLPEIQNPKPKTQIPNRSQISNPKIILVAGGFGVAPFVGLVDILREQGVETTLYYGGKTADDILLIDEFEKMGMECRVTTEDGSLGEKGLITELLAGDIRHRTKDQRPNDNKSRYEIRDTRYEIYCCGPSGLTEAVIKIAKKHKIPAQVSYETYMGCGIGVCLGCAVETPEGFVRACKEGPVFLV